MDHIVTCCRHCVSRRIKFSCINRFYFRKDRTIGRQKDFNLNVYNSLELVFHSILTLSVLLGWSLTNVWFSLRRNFIVGVLLSPVCEIRKQTLRIAEPPLVHLKQRKVPVLGCMREDFQACSKIGTIEMCFLYNVVERWPTCSHAVQPKTVPPVVESAGVYF